MSGGLIGMRVFGRKAGFEFFYVVLGSGHGRSKPALLDERQNSKHHPQASTFPMCDCGL